MSDAQIILRVRINSVCNPEDVTNYKGGFSELVRELIDDEGTFVGLIEDDFDVIAVEEIKDELPR
jgi:hypothetical protein